MNVITIEYLRGNHVVTRKRYQDLPESLLPRENDIVQQADSSEDDEFKVIKFVNETAICQDLYSIIQRVFYIDSLRISAKELKRQKRQKIIARKVESERKKQEKIKKRTLRELGRREKEAAKANRKFKHGKVKEVIIKFI